MCVAQVGIGGVTEILEWWTPPPQRPAQQASDRKKHRDRGRKRAPANTSATVDGKHEATMVTGKGEKVSAKAAGPERVWRPVVNASVHPPPPPPPRISDSSASVSATKSRQGVARGSSQTGHAMDLFCGFNVFTETNS
jgi:hypothetical protein